MDKKEESNEETIQFVSNPFLPLPSVRLPSELNDSSSFKPIQRKMISQDDQENKSSSIKDPILIKFSSPRLNRSISTSTTSLKSPSFSFQLIDSYIFLFTIVISFVFLGIILYNIC